MTGRGTNGLSTAENLSQQRRKRVFEVDAQLEHSKCPAHPTKRMWTVDIEAIREAEVRSEAARMAIVAYRCAACGNAHLCKATNAREGSTLTRPEPVLPLVPGNADARLKMLRGYLEDETSVRTEDLVLALEIPPKSLGPLMKQIGWHNTRGRHARWVPTPPPTVTVEQADNAQAFADAERQASVAPLMLTPIDLATRRHPAAQQTGWSPMLNLDTIRHIPIGDVIDMLTTMGRELRIQTREIP